MKTPDYAVCNTITRISPLAPASLKRRGRVASGKERLRNEMHGDSFPPTKKGRTQGTSGRTMLLVGY